MKRNLTKSMLMTALICGTISIIPHGVYAEEAVAEEDLQGFTLDQVVVTATRTKNKLIDTAANVSIVTAEDIEKHNYKTAADALKNVPGVNILHNGGEQEKHIILNGDSRVIIMVDGVRMNQEKGSSFTKQGYDISDLPSVDAIIRI